MTNPDQMVRTRARAGGRASVYEANAWCQQFTTGILSEGATVRPNQPADMNISIGGTPANPAVIIAKTASGYNIALDLVATSLQQITAPVDNKRKTAVIVYTDDITLKSDEVDVTGSPATCGLILVNGASGAEPIAPSEEEIRTAITQDGATGAQAAYAVIAEITTSAGQMAITNGDIKLFNVSTITKLSPGIVTSQNIDWGTFASNCYYANAAEGSDSAHKDYKEKCSVEVPAGVYAIFAGAQFYRTNSGGSGRCYIRVKGEKQGTTSAWSYLTTQDYSSCQVTLFAKMTFNEPQKVSLDTQVGNPERGKITLGGSTRLIALRIG